MKKLISSFIALGLVFTLVIPAFAADEPENVNILRVGTVEGTTGQTISVPVEALLTEEASGLGFVISYDPEQLTLVGTTVNSDVIEDEREMYQNLTRGDGTAKFLVDWVAVPKLTNDTLFYLNFIVNDGVEFGDTTVAITSDVNEMMTKANIEYANVSVVSGGISFAPAAPTAPVETEPVETEPVIEHPAIIYSESTPVPVIMGDINCDGKIDILDVITIQQSILGKAKLSYQQKLASDINKNGIFDELIDFMAILQQNNG